MGRPSALRRRRACPPLNAGEVLAHPVVIGEIALGGLRRRENVPAALLDLPFALVAMESEVLGFIDRHALFGPGIGYVDAHLRARAPDRRSETVDERP
jgi:hypothetical protein